MNLVRPPTVMLPLVDVTRTPTGLWLHLSGEIDLLNSDELRTELSAIDLCGTDPLHLDLQRLTFCDSEGTRVIVRFLRRADLLGHRATIHGATSLLHKVLVLIGDGARLTFE
jgi:anti-anti-sigma factor